MPKTGGQENTYISHPPVFGIGGRGLSMIFEDCKRTGLPQPTVTDERGVVRVTFMRPN